jgi:hypothetical protein
MADIDMLGPVTVGLDIERYDNAGFSFDDNYILSKVFGDIVLIEYNDTDESGDMVKRGSLFVPVAATRSLWRRGRVILAGPDVKHCAVGDVVMFPHDRGIAVTNALIAGYGTVNNGKFLNEQRLFGVCEKIEQ